MSTDLKMVHVILPCGRNGRSKVWHRAITSVARQVRNGYDYQGDFVGGYSDPRVERRAELAVGTVVISCDSQGDARVGVVNGDGGIDVTKTCPAKGWAVVLAGETRRLLGIEDYPDAAMDWGLGEIAPQSLNYIDRLRDEGVY